MARWYIIHAYSGFENKVRDQILSDATRMGLERFVESVEVPTETVTEARRGKKGITASPSPAATRSSIDVLREMAAASLGTKPRCRQRSVTQRARPPRSRCTALTKGISASSAS